MSILQRICDGYGFTPVEDTNPESCCGDCRTITRKLYSNMPAYQGRTLREHVEYFEKLKRTALCGNCIRYLYGGNLEQWD